MAIPRVVPGELVFENLTNVAVIIDGKSVGSGRVDQAEPLVLSADETCDVGNEYPSPVTPDYGAKKSSGEVNWVEIDVDKAAGDADHVITQEELLHVTMAFP
jgi:arylsulfatase